MQRIDTSIDIDAPPEAVWAVLSDWPAYPDWNPFVVSLTGDAVVGGRLETRLQPVGGRAMTFKPQVTVLEPNRHLAWFGRLGLPRIFDGEHHFVLEEIEGGTRFVQYEELRGIAVPLLRRSLAKTVAGFRKMNEALKERVEAGVDAPSGR